MRRHRYYQEMLPLLLYGELDDAEKRELDGHLAGCEECRKELDGFRKTHSLLSHVPAKEVRSADLQQARVQLFNALDSRHRSPGIVERFREVITPAAWPRPAFAIGGIALFAAGFLLARFVIPGTATEPDAAFSVADSDVQIRNVQFADNVATGENVEFAFDAVKPIKLKGPLNNPTIQKVLAHALLNEHNPGVRLRAASSIVSTRTTPMQREVKAALLLTLASDKNAGVRKEALTALLRYPADREVRDALLQTLLHDENPSLRIAAINGLDSLRSRGYELDHDLLEAFMKSVQHDENLYVRVKAESIYQEEKEQ